MGSEETNVGSGLRILVVEDDYLIAGSLTASLEGLGYEVVGPASTAAAACELIRSKQPDAAVLDVKLNPGTSEPAARALRYRGIPFFFVTGFDDLSMLPDELRGYRVLQKPIDVEDLRGAVARALADRNN